MAEVDADTTPEPDEPAPTTTAAPDAGAAQAVVDEFFAAYNAGDTDAVMALFAAGAAVTERYDASVPAPSAEPIDRVDVENGLAWNHAQREVWTEPACELAASQLATGATLDCRWETLDAVVQAVGGEPIPTNALIVVADEAVVGLHRAFAGPDFSTLGTPFGTWMESSHPDVQGADCCSGDTREESEQRGALRAEWAQAWAAWLDEWGCASTFCTIPAERWVAEYDARCVVLDPSAVPTPDFVAAVRLVPRVLDQRSSTGEALFAADEALIAPDISDELAAELQRQRLDAMIELGIDEACHPAT